ncbi:MAG: outer membrane protein OmpA-like peptidoglycan-associated protein [Flavobacteriales bacterium]|jgi:outer membrane protein OmpA-like peptidoglycan-associated protein
MKKRLTQIALLCLTVLFSFNGNAQQDLVLRSMDGVPQHMYGNPASRPESRLNIGLPGISSIYFRHENTVYNPFQLFENKGSSSALRTEHFQDYVKKLNHIGAEAAVDLVSFGFAVGEKNYFSFSIRERFQARLTLPGDMVLFPFTGNASFDELENGTLDFSGFRLGLNHYRETAVGWQYDYNEDWSFGVRLKLLYGYENIDTKASSLQWQTDETTYDWTLTGEMDVNSSGVYMLTDSIDDNSDLENDAINDYFLKRKNRGLGIDFGAVRRVNDKLSVNASVNDLGYIKWKSYTKNFDSNEGSFIFSGLELTDQTIAAGDDFDDSLDVVVEDLVNELEESFAYSDNEASYRSAILARVQLGASYELYAKEKSSGTAGMLVQSEIYKGHFRPTITLNYQQKVGRWLTAQLAYSVIDRNFRNLGAGLSLNGGPIQFYIATDNLLASVFDQVSESTTNEGILYPRHATSTQVHMGINLTFGRKKKDRDGDGIVDKKDDCPDVFGLETFAGCPDTDGDGITDAVDLCPELAGLKEFMGCPDSDNDGITDAEDDCPDTPGIPEFKGCPDSDADGVQDSEDDCPEIPGLTEFKGCPDTDDDGIRDPEDNCPEIAGPAENNGCPWTDQDGDGILDKDDACPDEAGPAENQGCPYSDVDGDGVLDKDDLCPSTPGPAENQGCPVIEEEEQEILNTAFENLEFVSGKAVIKEGSTSSLQELAVLLNEKDTWKLQIAGHTDSSGNDDKNMQLSKERSQAVADFVERYGVSKDRMIIQWFGETEPVGDNATEEGRQKNRRVVMTVVFD